MDLEFWLKDKSFINNDLSIWGKTWQHLIRIHFSDSQNNYYTFLFPPFHDHIQNPSFHLIINHHSPAKMSLASIQYIRIPNSSSSSTTSAGGGFRFSATKPTVPTIRCTQADGPLRRPSIATPPVRPSGPPSSAPPPPTPPSPPSAPVAETTQSSVTLEYQRQVAKELQEYFKQKKLEEANQGPFFGFIAKNEISNGRFVILFCFCFSHVFLFSEIYLLYYVFFNFLVYRHIQFNCISP